jgi:hypothetical protein
MTGGTDSFNEAVEKSGTHAIDYSVVCEVRFA